MSITNKLGNYAQVREQAKTKTIKVPVNDALLTLKVRMPSKEERDKIIEAGSELSQEMIDEKTAELMANFKVDKSELDEEQAAIVKKEFGISFTEDGKLLYKDRPIEDLARDILRVEVIWQEQLKLIKTDTDEFITLQEFREEFDEDAQNAIIEAVSNAVTPNYLQERKN